MTGAQVSEAIAAKKIVLAGANRWPEWPQHIRVTVGTNEEMAKFHAAITAVLKEGPEKHKPEFRSKIEGPERAAVAMAAACPGSFCVFAQALSA